MIYIRDNNYIMTNNELIGDYLKLDENTDLGKLYLDNYPYVEVVQENSIITNMIVLEKPEKQPIKLQKSELEILQERILQLEVAEVNRKSIEIEQKILGGI